MTSSPNVANGSVHATANANANSNADWHGVSIGSTAATGSRHSLTLASDFYDVEDHGMGSVPVISPSQQPILLGVHVAVPDSDIEQSTLDRMSTSASGNFLDLDQDAEEYASASIDDSLDEGALGHILGSKTTNVADVAGRSPQVNGVRAASHSLSSASQNGNANGNGSLKLSHEGSVLNIVDPPTASLAAVLSSSPAQSSFLQKSSKPSPQDSILGSQQHQKKNSGTPSVLITGNTASPKSSHGVLFSAVEHLPSTPSPLQNSPHHGELPSSSSSPSYVGSPSSPRSRRSLGPRYPSLLLSSARRLRFSTACTTVYLLLAALSLAVFVWSIAAGLCLGFVSCETGDGNSSEATAVNSPSALAATIIDLSVTSLLFLEMLLFILLFGIRKYFRSSILNLVDALVICTCLVLTIIVYSVELFPEQQIMKEMVLVVRYALQLMRLGVIVYRHRQGRTVKKLIKKTQFRSDPHVAPVHTTTDERSNLQPASPTASGSASASSSSTGVYRSESSRSPELPEAEDEYFQNYYEALENAVEAVRKGRELEKQQRQQRRQNSSPLPRGIATSYSVAARNNTADFSVDNSTAFLDSSDDSFNYHILPAPLPVAAVPNTEALAT